MVVPKLPLYMTGLLYPYHLWWWQHYGKRHPFLTDWNRTHEAIFVHIPKTAGTTVFEALDMPAVVDTHAPSRAYQRANPELFGRSFLFSFVRNPWDRFASSFYFMKSGTNWDMQQQWAARHIGNRSFEDFTLALRRPLFRRKVLAERFFWPQSFWITDRRGSINVANVFRMENLEADIASLCARFGTKPPDALPHHRKTDRPDYRTLYTREMAEIVGKLYRDDIRVLGYAFEGGR